MTNNLEQSEAAALESLKRFRDQVNMAIAAMEVGAVRHETPSKGPYATDFEIIIGDYVIKKRHD